MAEYRRNPIPEFDLLDCSSWNCARWSINKMVCDRVAGFFAGQFQAELKALKLRWPEPEDDALSQCASYSYYWHTVKRV